MSEVNRTVYIEYNVNPKGKKTGDCAIRAVAVATGLGWDKAYAGLVDIGFKLKTTPSDVEAVEKFLLSQGFLVGTVKVRKGEHRPTVDSFATEHPNMYAVLRVAGHLTCCGRGNYVDIWDCGDKSVYKYWYKMIV